MKIIALDADGVILDYNLAYAKAWERVFGYYPVEKNPNGYSVTDRWDVPFLESKQYYYKLLEIYSAEFWKTIPPIEKSLEACKLLKEKGYKLICVSAISQSKFDYRWENLLDIGFPIDELYARPRHTPEHSPKAELLNKIKPFAFVDDFLPYFKDVDKSIHRALITRHAVNSPNDHVQPGDVTSIHHTLWDFANFIEPA